MGTKVEQDELQVRIDRTHQQLIQACDEKGLFRTVDDRVSESSATLLLGYSEGSLKNLRAAGGVGVGAAPPYYRRPAGSGGRISYRLIDIAIWLEQAREEV